MEKKQQIDTVCVQGGYHPGNGEPRQIPIVQSTTFKYATGEDMGKLFDLEASGYFYSRLQNPTCDTVAARICALEGGSAEMLTSSGQAANFFAVFNIASCGDHVIACVCDVENGKEVCRLTRGGQHCRRTTLQLADAGRNGVAGGVLKSGVEVARCLKVEELSHILAGGIFEGSALHDGNLARLAVAGSVAALYALGFNSEILSVHFYLFPFVMPRGGARCGF